MNIGQQRIKFPGVTSKDVDHKGNKQTHYEDGRTTTHFGGPCGDVTTDEFGRECCPPDEKSGPGGPR